MAIHGCMVLHRICQYCLILNATCESCKALKIDSFAKNHKNNDGQGSLLKDMIIDLEYPEYPGTAVCISRQDDKDGN